MFGEAECCSDKVWLDRHFDVGKHGVVLVAEGDCKAEGCALCVVDDMAVLYLVAHADGQVSLHNQMDKDTHVGWDGPPVIWKMADGGELELLNADVPGGITYVLGWDDDKGASLVESGDYKALTFEMGVYRDVLDCDDSKCSSSGDVCCAPGPEPATCRDGYTPRFLGEGWCGVGTYTCCKNTAASIDSLPGVDTSMSSCHLDKDWPTITAEVTADQAAVYTGGLGKLMKENELEVWLCHRDHNCSTPSNYMCWAYLEKEGYFAPWATNNSLHLIRDNGKSAGDCDRALATTAYLESEYAPCERSLAAYPTPLPEDRDKCITYLRHFTHDFVGSLKGDLQDCRAQYGATEGWNGDWEVFVDVGVMLYSKAWSPARKLGLQEYIPMGEPELDWCEGAIMTFELRASACNESADLCSDDCKYFVSSLTPGKMEALMDGISSCASKWSGHPFKIPEFVHMNMSALEWYLVWGPWTECGFEDVNLNRPPICRESDAVRQMCAGEDKIETGVSAECFGAISSYYTEGPPRPPLDRACDDVNPEDPAANMMVSPACKVSIGIPCGSCDDTMQVLYGFDTECPRACKSSDEDDSSLRLCEENEPEHSPTSCGVPSCMDYMTEFAQRHRWVTQGLEMCTSPGVTPESLLDHVMHVSTLCGISDKVADIVPPASTCAGATWRFNRLSQACEWYCFNDGGASCAEMVSAVTDEMLEQVGTNSNVLCIIASAPQLIRLDLLKIEDGTHALRGKSLVGTPLLFTSCWHSTHNNRCWRALKTASTPNHLMAGFPRSLKWRGKGVV